MKKVLISGGKGLVGSRLTEMLEERNYQVSHLSRSPQESDRETIIWDVEKGILDANAIKGFNYIIHLAGAGIADKRWTEKRKQLIRDSRVKSTELLKRAIEAHVTKPESFISASAIGYYGLVSGEHSFKEEEPHGDDFLGETCKLWEDSVDKISALGIPTSKIRIGIVLTKKGGALREMEKPIKWGLAAALGSGKQYIPWIHVDDLCRIFIYVLENNLEGIYNAASPYQVNNNEFTKHLANVLGKRKWLPNVPGIILKLILGRRSSLVLEGSRVDVHKIQSKGFKFLFPKLEEALNDIYNSK